MPFSLEPRYLALVWIPLLLLSTSVRAQQHFTECLPTNVNDATVLLPINTTVHLDEKDIKLSSGDEVALFSNDGRCAGMATINTEKESVAITVANKDTTAGILEGYESGESLKYRIWRQSPDTVLNASATYACTLSGCRSKSTYKRNVLFEVSGMSVSSSPLPVEMTTLKASRSGKGVLLEWRTESETNNSGFEVQQKRTDGSSWSTLSFVEGAGTVSTPQTYRYTADDLEYGTHQFRLKQVDHDGSTSTSETLRVELTLERPYKISKVYPNPIQNTGSLKLTVKESQHVTVHLYDLLGRRQATLLNQKINANHTQTMQISGRTLPSGKYFLRIRGSNFATNRQLTVVQ